MLAPPIRVQRPKPAQRLTTRNVIEPRAAIAIGRRRGGVDETLACIGAPPHQIERRTYVAAHYQIHIRLGRGADGSHVHDCRDIASMALQPAEQVFRCDEVDDLVLREIAPALVTAEPVAHDNRLAATAKLCDQIRADEAGPARDDVHAHLPPPATPRIRAASSRSRTT